MTSNAPSAGSAARPRTALVVPGIGYTPARPLLHYARAVLEQHGWDVRELWWEVPGTFQQFTEGERLAWVERQVVAAVEAEGCGLLVGKSLGTLAAGIATERSLPAIWLTPLLTTEPVLAALDACVAPTLLVGGTADPLWDAEAVRRLPHKILEFDGADHSLQLPGDAVGSVALLGRLVETMDRFAGGAAHTSGPPEPL
ncbi:alpha/beta hydrolase [Streptomyces sp. PT12]|uniref:alpha/beta hydrolase n=1 Tax=Streptomyces sp. PT12 TaxID=1510197 RepID=UPI000DE47794|nr:alpha/beta hydrolase [Streptomyces sp. PT12]RBM21914.1 alpha/beta hydrolase [Streptomyces sp. PT12]